MPTMEVSGKDLAPVYALLSRLFLKEADVELVQELARPEIAEVMDGLEPGFQAQVEAPWSDAQLEESAAEYARLFLMPGGVTPFAAGWIEGEEGAVRADLEEKISTLYDALRVRPADFGLGNVPSDHIGMLLALTSYALQVDASGGLPERSLALLSDWAPRFADRVRAESDSVLYRGAAALLGALLAE